MSIDTHSHEMIIGLMSSEIKDAISKLYDLHTQNYGNWPKSGVTANDHRTILFHKEGIIIPDLSVMQVSSYEEKNYLQSIDHRTLLNKEYITGYPILFIYEFTGHNILVINKIHISLWCQHKKVYPDGDIDLPRYEYMDQYLEQLIEFLNKLPDLEVVNLNMTFDGDTIKMLTKKCQYFKITKATEQKLNRNKELKLSKHHLSDKLKNNKFRLNVYLEYMVRSRAPWTDPVTGMTRYYRPKPKEDIALRDLEWTD